MTSLKYINDIIINILQVNSYKIYENNFIEILNWLEVIIDLQPKVICLVFFFVKLWFIFIFSTYLLLIFLKIYNFSLVILGCTDDEVPGMETLKKKIDKHIYPRLTSDSPNFPDDDSDPKKRENNLKKNCNISPTLKKNKNLNFLKKKIFFILLEFFDHNIYQNSVLFNSNPCWAKPSRIIQYFEDPMAWIYVRLRHDAPLIKIDTFNKNFESISLKLNGPIFQNPEITPEVSPEVDECIVNYWEKYLKEYAEEERIKKLYDFLENGEKQIKLNTESKIEAINFDNYYLNLNKKINYKFNKIEIKCFDLNIIKLLLFPSKYKHLKSVVFLNKFLFESLFTKKLIWERIKLRQFTIDTDSIAYFLYIYLKKSVFDIYHGKSYITFVPHLFIKMNLKLSSARFLNLKFKKSLFFLKKKEFLKLNNVVKFFNKNLTNLSFKLKFKYNTWNLNFLNINLVIFSEIFKKSYKHYIFKELWHLFLYNKLCFYYGFYLKNVVNPYKNFIKIKHLHTYFFKYKLDYFKLNFKKGLIEKKKKFLKKNNKFFLNLFKFNLKKFKLNLLILQNYLNPIKIKVIKIRLNKILLPPVFFFKKFLKLNHFFKFKDNRFIFFFKISTILTLKKKLISAFNLEYKLNLITLKNNFLQNYTKKFRIFIIKERYYFLKKFRRLFFISNMKRCSNKVLGSKEKGPLLLFFTKKKLLKIFLQNIYLSKIKLLKSKKIKILKVFLNFKKNINLKKFIYINFFDMKSFFFNSKVVFISLVDFFSSYKKPKYFFLKKKFKIFRIIALILSLIFFTPLFTNFENVKKITFNIYRFYRKKRHSVKRYIIIHHFYHYWFFWTRLHKLKVFIKKIFKKIFFLFFVKFLKRNLFNFVLTFIDMIYFYLQLFFFIIYYFFLVLFKFIKILPLSFIFLKEFLRSFFVKIILKNLYNLYNFIFNVIYFFYTVFHWFILRYFLFAINLKNFIKYKFIFYYTNFIKPILVDDLDPTILFITFKEIKFVTLYIFKYIFFNIIFFFKYLNLLNYLNSWLHLYINYFFLKYFFLNYFNLKAKICLCIIIKFFSKNKIKLLIKIYYFLTKNILFIIFFYLWKIFKKFIFLIKSIFLNFFFKKYKIKSVYLNFFYKIYFSYFLQISFDFFTKTFSFFFQDIFFLKIKYNFFSKIKYFFFLKDVNDLKKKSLIKYIIKKNYYIIFFKKFFFDNFIWNTPFFFLKIKKLIFKQNFKLLKKFYLLNTYNLYYKLLIKLDFLIIFCFFYKLKFFKDLLTITPLYKTFPWKIFDLYRQTVFDFSFFFYVKLFYLLQKKKRNLDSENIYFFILNNQLVYKLLIDGHKNKSFISYQYFFYFFYNFQEYIHKRTLKKFLFNIYSCNKYKTIFFWIFIKPYELRFVFTKKYPFFTFSQRLFTHSLKFFNKTKLILINFNYLQNYLKDLFDIKWFIMNNKLFIKSMYFNKIWKKKNKYFKVKKLLLKETKNKLIFLKKKNKFFRKDIYIKNAFDKNSLYLFKKDNLFKKKLKIKYINNYNNKNNNNNDDTMSK